MKKNNVEDASAKLFGLFFHEKGPDILALFQNVIVKVNFAEALASSQNISKRGLISSQTMRLCKNVAADSACRPP